MPTKTKQFEAQRIPKLRFSGFLGEPSSADATAGNWEEKKLGGVVTFFKGKGIAKDDVADDGKNKCIRYGELYTEYHEIIKDIKSRTNISADDSFLSKENDVLIPSSGETALDIATVSCVRENDVLLGGDLNILRPDENQSGVFLAYYLTNFQNINIARLAQGNSVVHLYSSTLKQLKINLPSLPEQQKIASFLGVVDEWIENLRTQKESLGGHKKGMMQKIFIREVRFKNEGGEEFGDWEIKKLGAVADIYQPQTISQTDLTNEGYVVYGANGIIGKYSKFNHEHEQIAVTCRGNTCGNINYTCPKAWITGNAMVINLDNNKNIYKKYFYYLLKYQSLDYLITGSGQPQITGDIKQHKVEIPCLQEQRKIAGFLISIDNLIELKQQQIAKAEEWKRGLTQGLFV